MRNYIKTISVCAMCALLSAPFLSAQDRQTNNTNTVIFAVGSWSNSAAEAVIDPIAFVNNGRFSETSGDDAFRAEFYRRNTEYLLLFGGARVGSLSVAAPEPLECMPSAARATIRYPLRFTGDEMALATNSDSLGGTQNARIPPTNAESAAVLSLVRSEFRRRGAPASSLRSVTIENLTALDLNHDGRHELVGSFAIKRARPFLVRQLFVIAEPQTGGSYRLSLVRHEVLRQGNLMGEVSVADIGRNAFLTETLIDCLDTDGDGTEEVFTRALSFEGTHYAIYRRESRGWQRTYEVYNYRCGY